jgi:hypothetical protein
MAGLPIHKLNDNKCEICAKLHKPIKTSKKSKKLKKCVYHEKMRKAESDIFNIFQKTNETLADVNLSKLILSISGFTHPCYLDNEKYKKPYLCSDGHGELKFSYVQSYYINLDYDSFKTLDPKIRVENVLAFYECPTCKKSLCYRLDCNNYKGVLESHRNGEKCYCGAYMLSDNPTEEQKNNIPCYWYDENLPDSIPTNFYERSNNEYVKYPQEVLDPKNAVCACYAHRSGTKYYNDTYKFA